MLDSPTTGLTDRQRLVLEFICASIDSRGFPPTLREIGVKLNIRSTNGVNDHLRALERKGYLTREDMKSRTIRPTTRSLELLGRPASDSTPAHVDDEQLVEIPIVGRVAAGPLTEALQSPTDTVRVDRMLLGSRARGMADKDVFGLRIQGESMIEAGIFDGDFIFVRKQPEAPKGAIIVAMVGDEATCKYYFPEAHQVRLEPANASMRPILIPRSEWRETAILGVVVGVYRRLNA